MNTGCLPGIPPPASGLGAGEAKAWVAFEGATGRILASRNVANVRRGATGNYLIQFIRPFATPYFATLVSVKNVNDATNFMLGSISSTDAGKTQEKRIRTSASGVATDADEVYVAFYGDQ